VKPQVFLIALWKHECARVFVDKLINLKDKGIVERFIHEQACETWNAHKGEIDKYLSPENEIFFCHFLQDELANEDNEVNQEVEQFYEAIQDIDELRKKV
jgi:dynein heavy chain